MSFGLIFSLCTHGKHCQFHGRIKCSDGVDAQINYLQVAGT